MDLDVEDVHCVCNACMWVLNEGLLVLLLFNNKEQIWNNLAENFSLLWAAE